MIKLICVSAFVLFTLCSQSKGDVAPEDLVHASKFLKKYGYMDPTSKGDSESMRESVAAMQQFAGLEATGEINAKTMDKMRSKRCSLPDIDASSGNVQRFTNVSKWSFLRHTYNVLSFPPNRSACLTNQKIDEFLNYAFKNWSSVLTGLTVVPAPAGTNGTIRITFGAFNHGDKFSFDGKGTTLAHAFYPENGRLDFDASEFWGCFNEFVAGTKTPYTYFNEVALHEFGHILGLGHSNVSDAVMYPFYHGNTETMSLAQDDINGIRSLYGLKP